MNFHLIDWAIVGALFAGMGAVAWYIKGYTRDVSDFLSANRSAGRYLLTTAEGMAGIGVITIVAQWEKFYAAGFAAAFWGQMLMPIGLIIALSGWVAYRFRETRAMTMAQFFEMRYSRRFRVFAGVVAWVSGVINYAIFPGVTARFLIYFMGLPVYHVDVLGFDINATLGVVMAVLLIVALIFTLTGGQITVMVTDFLQGQLMNIAFLAVMILLLLKFQWPTIVESLQQAPANRSMLNPFDQGELPDFGPTYFIMMAALGLYGHMAWQGSQGFYSAAKSPHEAKMSRILASWRGGVTYILLMFIPICAYTLMHDAGYAIEAASANATLTAIPEKQIQTQMTTTATLIEILPIGLAGLFCAIMIAAAVSTDETYLHSWGSIFVQDVLLPLRKKPLETQQHLRWLRWSIVGVAVFAWTFSLLFPLREYILMWQQITGAIFLGGAGAVIIGGLYWPRGTAAGAWAAMIVGAGLSVIAIVLQNLGWAYLVPMLQQALPDAGWTQALPDAFPLNGVQMSFATAILAVMAYVAASLLSGEGAVDMDQLLHRGKYRVEAETPPAVHAVGPIARRLGITSEFTRGDRWIYYAKILWTLFFFGIFGVFTVWNLLIERWSDVGWSRWWYVNLWIGIVVGVITTVWFLIGGFRDLRDLLRDLSKARTDALDNGTVTTVLTHEQGAVPTVVVPAHIAPAPTARAAT